MPAVTAVHGPEDGEHDPQGNVGCEVIGSVRSGQGLPTGCVTGDTVYVSGDYASIRTVAENSRRVPDTDAAVLHAGAAHVPATSDGWPLSSLDSRRRAAAAAAVPGVDTVVPAHHDGWAHFFEGLPDIDTACHEAGPFSLPRSRPWHGGCR